MFVFGVVWVEGVFDDWFVVVFGVVGFGWVGWWG